MAKRLKTTECLFDRALRQAILDCEDLTGLIQVLCHVIADYTYDPCPPAEKYEWNEDTLDHNPASFSSLCNCSESKRDRKFELKSDDGEWTLDGTLRQDSCFEPMHFYEIMHWTFLRVPRDTSREDSRRAMLLVDETDQREIAGIVDRTRCSESTECIKRPEWV